MKAKHLACIMAVLTSAALHAENWTAIQTFAGTRSNAVSFSIGHFGYIGTGIQGTSTLRQDMWRYDPVTNVWQQKATFPAGVRKNAIVFVVGGKAYAGLGSDGTSVKNDLWQYDPTTNQWTQKANIGGVAREQAVAFAVGAFGYVGTGLNQSSTALNDFWRYDPSLNQWVQRANFAGGLRSQATGFSVNGTGYITLGRGTGGLKNDTWAYSPGSDTWAQKANYGGAARTDATAMTLGNLAYVGTGQIVNGTTDMWAYDPVQNSWTQRASFPGTARFACAAFSIAGKGYMGTGVESLFGQPNQRRFDFYQYDPTPPPPADNSWTQKANLGGAKRYGAVGFSIGSKGYIGTGTDQNNNRLSDFWEFDPVTSAWTQKANFGGIAREQAVGFSIGSKGYIGTGTDHNANNLNDFWEYDPASNTWAQKANFGGVGRLSAVGFSIGSKGYIGIGWDRINLLNDFWEYNPASNAWTQKANFGGIAREQAVGFSIGSKGYIGTGYDSQGFFVSEFWEYDPTTNAWTQKADCGGQSRTVAIGFGMGAKGYIGTGVRADGTIQSDFWEYDPITNIWTQKADLSGASHAMAVGFSIGSKGYVGTGFFGNGLTLLLNDFWEYNPGQVNCSANQISLTLNTDAFGSETSWEIRPQGQVNPVCNGSGYSSNSNITVTCCLLNGCYDLRVFDSFGDGMTTGGFVLRDASNQRINDNSLGGGGFTTLSQVTNSDGTPWSFCLPIGADALVPSSCDQTFTLADNAVVQMQPNAAVTAQLGIGDNSDDGYQICIFDPNGGFRRNTFQSLSAPGSAFPSGTSAALKPTYFNLNFSQAPFLPTDRVLNVRVRSKVNGVFAPCGPACRIRLTAPACIGSQLTTTADPVISCGATNVSVNTGVLYATLVPGANKYQFNFTGPNNYVRNIVGPSAAVNSVAARTLQMASMTTNKPPCGVPITVQVRASFDGGTTYCAFGTPCTVTFSCGQALPNGGGSRMLRIDGRVALWPDPSSDGRFTLEVGDLTTEVQEAQVQVFDAQGSVVKQEVVPLIDGRLHASMDLGASAEGPYWVVALAGDALYSGRLVVLH